MDWRGTPRRVTERVAVSAQRHPPDSNESEADSSLTMWKVRCIESVRTHPGFVRGSEKARPATPAPAGVGVGGSSDQAHAVDALATTGDERRGSLRKAPGSWQISVDPEISEWGNPPARVSRPQSIRPGSEPGELKHLSTRRNRNQPRFRQ